MSTRRDLVTVMLLLAGSAVVFAQTREKPMENVGQKSQKYGLGIRFGPNISIGKFSKTLSDTILESHSNKPKPGFSVMGQLIFPLQKSYSNLIEFGYMRGGRRISYNDGDWENDFTYNFLTTSMGLRKSFKFHLREGVFYDWFVSVGPNIAYLINGKGLIKTSNGGRTPFKLEFSNMEDSIWLNQRKQESDVNTYYFNKTNRFFFGIDIGFGADVPITKRQKVYGEFRITLGQTYVKNRNTKAFLNTLGGEANLEPDPIYKPNNFSDPLKTNIKTFNFSLVYTLEFDKKAKKQGKSTNKNSNNRRKAPARRRR